MAPNISSVTRTEPAICAPQKGDLSDLKPLYMCRYVRVAAKYVDCLGWGC